MSDEKELEEKLLEAIKKKKEIEGEILAKLRAVAKATLKTLGYNNEEIDEILERLKDTIAQFAQDIISGKKSQDNAVDELTDLINKTYGRKEEVQKEVEMLAIETVRQLIDNVRKEKSTSCREIFQRFYEEGVVLYNPYEKVLELIVPEEYVDLVHKIVETYRINPEAPEAIPQETSYPALRACTFAFEFWVSRPKTLESSGYRIDLIVKRLKQENIPYLIAKSPDIPDNVVKKLL